MEIDKVVNDIEKHCGCVFAQEVRKQIEKRIAAYVLDCIHDTRLAEEVWKIG